MKLSPFRIAAIYLIVAMIWIFTTDSILEVFVSNPRLLTVANIAKGWFYVAITAGGLYYLINLNETEINKERQKLEKKDESLTLALESNKMATWEYYPEEDRYVTSSNHHSFFDFPQTLDLNLKHVFSRLHPDDVERFKDEVAKTLSKKKDFNVEYRVIHMDGSIHWLLTRGTLNIADGLIESVSGITSDITESKTLRRKLDFEKEKFETLFDQIPVLITVFNPELEINEVNREFESVLGWDPAEDNEQDLLNLLYPDEEIRKEAHKHMLNPGSGWKEFDVTTKAGEVRHQVWSNIQLSDSTIVGIGHDITERKKLENKEKKEHNRLLKIFNKLPVFINILDSKGNIIECNDFILDRLGYSEQEIIEGNLMEKLVPAPSSYRRVKSHIDKADNSWKNFEVYTKSGDKLNTSWMNMQLNESFTLGIGLDLTELKELEEQLTLAVKGGNVGLWDFYPKDNKVLINDEYANMLGYSREELTPLRYDGWADLTHPKDLDNTERLLEEHFKGKSSSYFNEIRMRHKAGHWVWMLDRGVVAERDENGDVLRITGTHIDITERKELEEQIELSRTRLKQATNSANIGLWEWNPQTGKVTIDEVWANLVGYTLDELKPISIDTWNELVHKDDLKRFEKAVDDYFSGKTDLYEIEVRMRHKDGHWVWILDRGKNIEWNDKGVPVKMIGTHVDITSLKKNEKRLRENERLLLETQRVANLGTFTEDLNTQEVRTSTVLNQMFWLPEGATLSSERLVETLHPDFKYVAQLYKKAIQAGELFEGEYKIQNIKDKRERWIYEKANVEFDKEGNPVRVIGAMLDVTRSKEQELRIKRTLAQLRKAEEIAEIGYWEKNLDTGKLYWGDNKYKLYGADPADGPLTRQDFFQRVHPDDRKATYDAYIDAENRGGMDITYRYKQPDGIYTTFREKAEVVRDDASGNEILRGVSMDISSIKHIESQLEDEQTRLRIITGLVSDVVWQWNFEYDTITWSNGMETEFGYRMQDLPEGEESWTDHLHPEDKERVIKSIKKAKKSNELYWEDEYRFFDSTGNIRYVLDQGYIFRDDEGKALKMIGAMIDQTETKISEEILSSQAHLLEDISDAVIATDENMKIVSWNRAAEMMYGWSEQEAIGQEIGTLIETEYENKSEESLYRELVDDEEWSGEVVQYNRIDEPMNIMSSIRVITDREGNFDGAVAVNKDITAIKEIQKRLSYEQRRFEYATSVVSDAIWDANPSEGSVWWSEGFETHYKHDVPSPEDGFQVWKDNLHPEDRDRVINDVKHAEDTGATEWKQEYRFYRGDGSLANVLDRAYILRNDKGDILRIIGAMNDITLQKEAEKELKKSEQQYRLLYELSPLPMYIFDKESFKFLSVNKALIDLFGYTKDEFLEMTIYDLFMPDEKRKIREEAMRNLQKTRSGFDLWRQKTKSDDIIYCEISGSDIYYRDKQQRLVLTIDITEQRKAEEKAIKAVVEGEERERHRIANELHDGLGQYLSAANMHLTTVYSDSGSMPELTDRSFRTGLQMLEHAISETRSISHNLLPKAIQDYGLKLAVESLVNEMQSTQEMSIYLFQKYRDDTVPGNIQINLFRIIQEALNNAIKHSGGTTININLVFSNSELICTIEDNGSGFDLLNLANEGLGLQSMKTRVAAMSGNLDIDSKENSGTLITAIVPLDKH
ncbi:PAS domain-containing protein [Rhodohalobacter sp. 8-1]|uniref:PAS domain-containing protein n=1 Tax=Rhodohalobacter sp. 8-1 TaxID=3131972 RepID=UPI0030EC139D